VHLADGTFPLSLPTFVRNSTRLWMRPTRPTSPSSSPASGAMRPIGVGAWRPINCMMFPRKLFFGQQAGIGQFDREVLGAGLLLHVDLCDRKALDFMSELIGSAEFRVDELHLYLVFQLHEVVRRLTRLPATARQKSP
jgi:hypothetical protein